MDQTIEEFNSKIAKIIEEFVEESGIYDKPEFPDPEHPPHEDIDTRLMDYSKEYIDNKPGVVTPTGETNDSKRI